ncbi:MAG TPA: TetR/AcrR family transcriptional regulator [Thermoanaerobaculia bacterium]|jgi:AcrR family transcriptional regulator|nr:TetR/AcrR family transcriptional regulator [Thermoanaerobaculia bacterium]
MGIKERRERERVEIREKILDAARELFATQGYEAVTMRKIAEGIEYSPTAIYFHFKDKETVLRALCEADFLALAGEFREIAKIADPVERLRATGLAYADFGLSHPNHYRLMFMTPHPYSKEEEMELHKGNPEEDAYAFLKGIVTEAIADGRLRPELDDPELVAQTMWAGMHGVISLQCAKAEDPWVEWRDFAARTRVMLDVLIRGMVRES